LDCWKNDGTGMIVDDTDGCAKQYRSGTALYLISLLATAHGVIIYRAVGAPGHGKDEVDGLNAVDKRFIAKKMSLIVTTEANASSSRMHAEARVDSVSMSIAREAARMCGNETGQKELKVKASTANVKNLQPWKKGFVMLTNLANTTSLKPLSIFVVQRALGRRIGSRGLYQVRTLQAQKVMSHESLLDEITRRHVIEFIEEEDDVLDRSNDDAPVISDEELDSDSSKNIVDDNE
jgi:hypothetical protein